MNESQIQAENKKSVVDYLRRSPRDTLKRDAADIIEEQARCIAILERQVRDLVAFKELQNQ